MIARIGDVDTMNAVFLHLAENCGEGVAGHAGDAWNDLISRLAMDGELEGYRRERISTYGFGGLGQEHKRAAVEIVERVRADATQIRSAKVAPEQNVSQCLRGRETDLK
jgi:hypothetical protein